MELPVKYQKLVKNDAKQVKKLLKVSSYYGVSFTYAVEDVYNIRIVTMNLNNKSSMGSIAYDFNNNQVIIYDNGKSKAKQENHLAWMLFILVNHFNYMPNIDWHFHLDKKTIQNLRRHETMPSDRVLTLPNNYHQGMKLLAKQFARDLMKSIRTDKYAWV